MDIMSFISSNLLIVIVAAYVLGVFLKKLDSIKDKYITSLLMLFSITIAVLLSITNAEYKTLFDAIINGLLQGILCWGVSVGVNQTIKQLGKEE